MRTNDSPSGAEEHRRGRDALNFHFHRAWQAVLQRDARAGNGIDRKLDANLAIAKVTGDARDSCGERAILRPRKALKPNNGALSRMQLAERGRLEFGDDLRTAAGKDEDELLPFRDLGAGMQRRAFTQAPRDGSADASALDFIFEAMNDCRRGRDIDIQLSDIGKDLLLAHFPVTIAHRELGPETRSGELKAIRGGPLALRVGFGVLGISRGENTFGLQPDSTRSLLLSQYGLRFRFLILRAGCIGRNGENSALIAAALTFGGQLSLKSGQLRLESGKVSAFLLETEALGIAIQLGEYIAGMNFLA